MHIDRVSIENIRRFGSEETGVDLRLPPHGWIVIAGPNGSGKTTFLQVLALALSPTLQHEFIDSMFTWLRRGVKRASSRLTLIPAKLDRFQTVGLELLSKKSSHEKISIGDDWELVHGAMKHSRQSDDNYAFAGPWNPDPDGWFAAGYGVYRRIQGQAGMTEAWATSARREGAFLTLFRGDSSLVHPIRWLMDLDYRSRDPAVPVAERREAESIVKNVIALLNDDLLDGMSVRDVGSRGLSVQQGDQVFSITELGAGAQILIAVVIDLLRHMRARFHALRFVRRQNALVVEYDGVVLIDEVEVHLHPAWQRRIGTWFCRHFPNVQFIVTTHSPLVCQAAVENGLILFPAPGTKKEVRVADPGLYHDVINGSVDEALLSGIFGFDHTWSEAAEERRERLATLEALVLSGKANKNERQQYKRLRSEISRTMSDDVDRVAAQLNSPKARK